MYIAKKIIFLAIYLCPTKTRIEKGNWTRVSIDKSGTQDREFNVWKCNLVLLYLSPTDLSAKK